jgi:hypothetical protein
MRRRCIRVLRESEQELKVEIKDLVKPAGLLAGLATMAVGTMALGYLVTRDRETLRRVMRVAAGTVERVSATLAETREEVADLWAEARENARHEMEDEAFAAPEAADDSVQARGNDAADAAQAIATAAKP